MYGAVPSKSRYKRGRFVRACARCDFYIKHADRVQHAELDCVDSVPVEDRAKAGRRRKLLATRRGSGGMFVRMPKLRSDAVLGRHRFPREATRQAVEDGEDAVVVARSGDVRRLVAALAAGYRGAVGHPPKASEAFKKISLVVPKDMSLQQFQRVADACFSNPHVCSLILTGSCVLGWEKHAAAVRRAHACCNVCHMYRACMLPTIAGYWSQCVHTCRYSTLRRVSGAASSCASIWESTEEEISTTVSCWPLCRRNRAS